MKSIQTEILIKAPQEKVWSILQDFGNYSDWNPFIISIKGKAQANERIEITLQPEGEKPQTFRPVLLSVNPNNKFCWRGVLRAKWIFSGTHYFILEKTGDNLTHFVHGETFSGILTKSILKKQGTKINSGFHAMNQALKQKAEQEQ